MKRRTQALTFFLAILIGSPLVTARTWTHVDGRKIEAELVSSEGDTVRLKVGQVVYDYPFEKLSTEDKEYIRSINDDAERKKTLETVHGIKVLENPDNVQFTAKTITLRRFFADEPSLWINEKSRTDYNGVNLYGIVIEWPVVKGQDIAPDGKPPVKLTTKSGALIEDTVSAFDLSHISATTKQGTKIADREGLIAQQDGVVKLLWVISSKSKFSIVLPPNRPIRFEVEFATTPKIELANISLPADNIEPQIDIGSAPKQSETVAKKVASGSSPNDSKPQDNLTETKNSVGSDTTPNTQPPPTERNAKSTNEISAGEPKLANSEQDTEEGAPNRQPGTKTKRSLVEYQNAKGMEHFLAGEYVEALTSFQRVLAYDDGHVNALNVSAWILATTPKKELRDAEKAFGLARRAFLASGEETKFDVIDTLSATYAAAGDFENAIKYQTQLVENAPNSLKEEYRRRLELYKQGKPFVDAVRRPKSGSSNRE